MKKIFVLCFLITSVYAQAGEVFYFLKCSNENKQYNLEVESDVMGSGISIDFNILAKSKKSDLKSAKQKNALLGDTLAFFNEDQAIRYLEKNAVLLKNEAEVLKLDLKHATLINVLSNESYTCE